VFTSKEGHSYTITDSFGGSWPVTFVDHGNTGVFRFANYKLVATQNNGSPQPTAGEAVGAAVGALLQNLFKQAVARPGPCFSWARVVNSDHRRAIPTLSIGWSRNSVSRALAGLTAAPCYQRFRREW
jgi:hypothetical protein